MKKLFKLSALILTVAMSLSVFAGCGADSGSGSGSGGTGGRDYDFYIFNTKGENADAMQATIEAYQTEKNVKIKLFSLGSGTNSDDTLRAEMNSKNKPAIFCTMSSNSLIEWKDGGFAMELSEATNPEFKKLAEAIPNDFKLTSDGSDSYGVPFNVEGYGYIVDTAILDKLFGADKTADVLAGFKAATYEEFETAVKTLTSFIKDKTPVDITLGGKSFSVLETALTDSKLEGVFSMAGSQKWTYGDHMINVAIDAVFNTSHDARNATSADVDKLKGPFVAYAKALDLKSTNAIGARGADFINDATNGYDASVQNFADGKAIFLKQGNWAYTNIKKANANITDTLEFIPIKMPFSDADVAPSGKTVEAINTSIPVFVPNYYLINKKASKEEQEMAQEFLVWLNTSATGQKFVTEDMAFIPYNADPATTKATYSLGNSIIDYMNSGKTISNSYAGAPNTWSGDVFGQEIMEKYLTKGEWTDADYTALADFGIAKWKELANLN